MATAEQIDKLSIYSLSNNAQGYTAIAQGSPVSAATTGASDAVSGTIGIMGQMTKTDVGETQKVLSATSNAPGLLINAATGNLKAGETAATLRNAASLAMAPKEAVKNTATAAEAVQTVKETGGLIQTTLTAAKKFLNPAPTPPPPPPPHRNLITGGSETW